MLVLALAVVCILLGLSILVALKRGYRFSAVLKGGGLPLAILLACGISFGVNHGALAAPASCASDQTQAAVSSAQSGGVGAAGPELVNDSISTSDTYITFNVLDNDTAPSGDPINPATLRLTGVWAETNSVSDARQTSYGKKSGTDLWVLNPDDSTNPTSPTDHADPADPWGEVYLASPLDGNGDPTTGEVEIDLLPEHIIPTGTTIHFTYTASTMSGVPAQQQGTVAVTVQTPTPNDDNYTFSGQSADERITTIDVMANDTASPGKSLDPSSLRFISSEDTQGGPITQFDYSSSQEIDGGEGEPEDNVISWSINEDQKVVVTYGAGVPAGTYSIQYTVANSLVGGGNDHGAYGSPATITITIPPSYPPTLVNDNASFASNEDFGVIPVIANDLPQSGDSMNASSLALIDPDTGDPVTDVYVQTIPGNGNSGIQWHVDEGVITVNFGSAVPVDTPLTVQYTANSTSGGQPSGPATITVTKDSSSTKTALVHAPIAFGDAHLCSVPTQSGDTIDLTDPAGIGWLTTTSGTFDYATVDLDPYTPGRQTTFTNQSGTITVNNSGLVTLTSYSGNDYLPFFFTIANTSGDITSVGIFTTQNYLKGCG